jgi:hypothetical protein
MARRIYRHAATKALDRFGTCSIWHALKCVRIKTWAALEREFAHFDGGGMSTCDGVIPGWRR